MTVFDKCKKVIDGCTSVEQLIAANVYLEQARLRRFNPLTSTEHRDVYIFYYAKKQQLKAPKLKPMEVAA